MQSSRHPLPTEGKDPLWGVSEQGKRVPVRTEGKACAHTRSAVKDKMLDRGHQRSREQPTPRDRAVPPSRPDGGTPDAPEKQATVQATGPSSRAGEHGPPMDPHGHQALEIRKEPRGPTCREAAQGSHPACWKAREPCSLRKQAQSGGSGERCSPSAASPALCSKLACPTP